MRRLSNRLRLYCRIASFKNMLRYIEMILIVHIIGIAVMLEDLETLWDIWCFHLILFATKKTNKSDDSGDIESLMASLSAWLKSSEMLRVTKYVSLFISRKMIYGLVSKNHLFLVKNCSWINPSTSLSESRDAASSANLRWSAYAPACNNSQHPYECQVIRIIEFLF